MGFLYPQRTCETKIMFVWDVWAGQREKYGIWKFAFPYRIYRGEELVDRIRLLFRFSTLIVTIAGTGNEWINNNSNKHQRPRVFEHAA